MDRGSDGRTLGHKRLYCAQYASNADIGKLLAPSSDSHRIHPPTTIVAASQNRTCIYGNPEKYRCPETLIGNVKESQTGKLTIAEIPFDQSRFHRKENAFVTDAKSSVQSEADQRMRVRGEIRGRG